MRPLERLDVYRLSRELAVRLYLLTKEAPLRHEFVLIDQVRRAVVSIPANIAEAYALGTRRQLVRGLRISLGSAEELRTHLWIAERVVNFGADRPLDGINADLDRVVSMLVGLLKRYGGQADT